MMGKGACAAALAICLALVGCGSAANTSPSASSQGAQEQSRQTEGSVKEDGKGQAAVGEDVAMRLSMDGTDVDVRWEDNQAVAELSALAARGPLTIQLSRYGGWEQVGPVGASLTSEDTQITAQAGDIMLYSGNQIVVFYGSNSWAYTRLGHIVGSTEDELAELLGSRDVVLTILAE